MDTDSPQQHEVDVCESNRDGAGRRQAENSDDAHHDDVPPEQSHSNSARGDAEEEERCASPERSERTSAAPITSGVEPSSVEDSVEPSSVEDSADMPAVSLEVGSQNDGGGASGTTKSQHKATATRPIRFCVSWATGLETVALEAEATIQDLQDAVLSAPDVPAKHKRFLYKGRLLEDDERVGDVPLHDGAVVHMLLRESEPAGRFVHIKSIATKQTRRVRCRADALVAEVKEELAAFAGERGAEEQRVLFAGRELEDNRTLREYNIQKPCVMVALARVPDPRDLEAFVAGVFPPREGAGVAVDAGVSVRFTSEATDAKNEWACMLGPPDLRTVTPSELRLLDSNRRPIPAHFSYDDDSRIVTLRPARGPLHPRAHYIVELNCPPFHRRECLFDPPDASSPGEEPSASASSPGGSSPGSVRRGGSWRGGALPPLTGVFHDRVLERVQGELRWSFFTPGYVPLRVASVLPRPGSAVSPDNAAVVLAFSGPLPSPAPPSLHMHKWVTVAGHPLKPPAYDPATLALIFEFATPPPPGSIMRVRVHAALVRGARGEALLPLQPDDILKADPAQGARQSSLRWRFFVEASPLYQPENAAAAGLAAVWQRWRGGKLALQPRPRRRGPLPAPPPDLTAPANPAPLPSTPGGSGSGSGSGSGPAVPPHMVYKPPSQSPGEQTGADDPSDFLDQDPPSPSPRPRVWAPAREGGGAAGEEEEGEEAGAGAGASTPGGGAPFVRPGYPLSLQVAVSPIVDLWHGAKQLLWQS